MEERKSVFLLIATIITTCLIVAVLTITLLYRTAIDEERARLIETAQFQARLIEATARFNAVYNKNYPGGPNPATLSQIIDAHDHETAVGKAEIVLSKKEGESIVFLLRHRHKEHTKPAPIPFESKMAEPTRRALSGQSGSVIGLDYHGQTVLAAYEPLKELNLGIVAKMDMADVRAPFVRTGLIIVFITVLVVSVGGRFFLSLTNPMVSELEQRAHELKKLNDDMKIEINERKQVENALLDSEKELEVRNKISNTFLLFSDENVYSEVLNVVLEAMGSDKGYLGFIDENGDLVTPSMTKDVWGQCMVSDKTIVFPRDSWGGLWGKSLVEKKTLYSNSPLSVPEGHIPLNRAMAVPIIFQDELIGQITIANKKIDYNQKDINLLESIVDSMAPILKARLQRDSIERSRRKAEEALKKAHDELDMKVKHRTAKLTEANKELKREIEERKRIQREVRESEERYALAVAGSTDGIWDWDILSNSVFYSNRFCEILGYSSEEFPNTVDAFRSHLHPKDANAVWSAVERHLQERVPYKIEYRMKTNSGKYRWFLARGQAIWDDKGNATRMSGSIQDITELKEAEESLQKSEEKYRLLITMLPGVLYKGYPDWRVEFIDEKIVALTGYSTDVFNSGRSKWSDIIVKEDLERVKKSFIDAFKKDKVFIREYRIRELSGELRWIQDRGNIVLNDRGEIKYISGVFFDITDRKKQEEEYNKTRNLLQTVFDGIPDPLVLLDESLKVRILNRAAMHYYQIEKTENIRGTCCYEAVMGKSAPCEGCLVPVTIASGKSGSFERKGVMNPNNLEQVNIYRFDEKGHNFGGALMHIQDITESRLMERKMIHNEKLALLGLTVSCITHEIANPMSAIIFNAPILKDYINTIIPIVDDYAKDREDVEFFQMPYLQFRKDVFKIIENVLHASKRINTIVSNLRKLYDKKRAQNKSWVNLKQLIEKINAVMGVEVNQHVKSFEIILKTCPKFIPLQMPSNRS